MNIIKNLLSTLLVVISFSVKAEIYTSTSVEEINNNLMTMLDKRNTEKTLVILPLENFLIEPTSPAFYIKDNEFQLLKAQATKKIKAAQGQYMGEVTLTQFEQRFSDPMIPEFIKNLQLKKTPFLAITRNFSGNLNKIPYLEVWTWKYLYDKGIDLSLSPIGLKQIMFNKGYKKIDGTYPTLYKGLLSCNSRNGENSPQSLIAYLLLEELKWTPDVIYVIDKEEGYIKSLQEQFKSLRPNLQVIGFVYAPPAKKDIQMGKKEFTKFWEILISKLNSVTRKESNNINAK